MTEDDTSLPMDEQDTIAPARTSRRGRPRKQRSEPVREIQRTGGKQFVGRAGEVLTRTRVNGQDPFFIPPEIEAQYAREGYSLQWNAVSVYNNKDIVVGQSMAMHANGWRPVPAERHPGLWVPYGTKGEIVREGQRLEERPLEMTEQARIEDQRAAREQTRSRDESLMGNRAGLRAHLGNQGIPMGGNVNINVDRSLDMPKPQYQPPDDSQP